VTIAGLIPHVHMSTALVRGSFTAMHQVEYAWKPSNPAYYR